MPPANTITLVQLLQERAARAGGRCVYTFLGDDDAEVSFTYSQLDQRAKAVAAQLLQVVSPGDRALLVFPSGPDFLIGFLGCLYAGVIAVPCAQILRKNELLRMGKIQGSAQAKVILSNESSWNKLTLVDHPSGLGRLPVVLVSYLDETPSFGAWNPLPDADQVAFLQYTSGSTGQPKGVMVTHRNIVTNESMIETACEHSEQSVMVNWLPHIHDMGLVAALLQPLYVGFRGVQLSTSSFLRNPLRWLKAISRYGGTTAGGPNFAYELCAMRAREGNRLPDDINLSSWDIAFCGAEPIRPGTIERFCETFAPYGFRPEAIWPCYGLAEATLIVTARKKGTGTKVDVGPLGNPVVSCGFPIGDEDVRIVDPNTFEEMPPGVEGEVWISGGHIAAGYWGLDEESQTSLCAHGPSLGNKRWLRTGDLGFFRQGELFISGRLKNIVIVRGQKVHAEDVENSTAHAHPDIRSGGVAAIAVQLDGEERLGVIAEIRNSKLADCTAVINAIQENTFSAHGVLPDLVALVPPSSLPKTTSGKMQRILARSRLFEGHLPLVGLDGSPSIVNRLAGVGSHLQTFPRIRLMTGERADLEEARPEQRRSLH